MRARGIVSTIQEVAQRAGVSTGTVSRYLNGYKLKQKNMDAIKQAIADLDYRPNLTARSLRRSRSMTIGLMINNMKNNLATQVVSQIETEIEQADYSMLIAGFRKSRSVFEQHLQTLVNRGIDGLILFEAPRVEDGHVDPVAPIDLPILSINTPYNAPNVDSILPKNKESSFEVVSKMIEFGHRHIGIIAAPQQEQVSRERLQGALDAISSAGLPPESATVLFGDYSPNSGRQCMSALLDMGVDCVFTCNYKMGMGALQAATEAGRTIGQNLSYACYDYDDTHEMFYPRLTTVCPPAYELGHLAGQELLSMIESGQRGSGKTTLLDNMINWQPSIVDLRG